MEIENTEYCFKGTLVAFVGDTPAVNLVGGFKEGVNMAMRKCRQCMATDSQIQTKVQLCLFIILKWGSFFSLKKGIFR